MRTVRVVSGWIYEANLRRVILFISLFANYEWDEFDSSSIESGVATLTGHEESWLGYVIGGIRLEVARDLSNGTLLVTMSGELNDEIQARLETMLFFN